MRTIGGRVERWLGTSPVDPQVGGSVWGPGRRRRVVAWLTIRGPGGEGMPSPLRCLEVITVLR